MNSTRPQAELRYPLFPSLLSSAFNASTAAHHRPVPTTTTTTRYLIQLRRKELQQMITRPAPIKHPGHRD